jgi:hypothetical protein
MIPAAPISSAFLIGTSSPEVRRITHGVEPAACSSDCIFAVSSVECSASMKSQSKPASAMSSATAGESSVSNGAKSVLPERSRERNEDAIGEMYHYVFETQGSPRRRGPQRPSAFSAPLR